MKNDVVEVQVKGVLPTPNGCAVFLGTDEKCFVIYVDHSVGAAITTKKITGRREIDAAVDPEAFLAEKMEEYRRAFVNPFLAARRGYIDEVILPRNTRRRLCRALNMLRGKKLENPWKKHDNIPL